MKLLKYAKTMILYSLSAVFTMTFIQAWFNGGRIVVDINSIGEARIELVLIALFWIVLFLNMALDLKGVLNEA